MYPDWFVQPVFCIVDTGSCLWNFKENQAIANAVLRGKMGQTIKFLYIFFVFCNFGWAHSPNGFPGLLLQKTKVGEITPTYGWQGRVTNFLESRIFLLLPCHFCHPDMFSVLPLEGWVSQTAGVMLLFDKNCQSSRSPLITIPDKLSVTIQGSLGIKNLANQSPNLNYGFFLKIVI